APRTGRGVPAPRPPGHPVSCLAPLGLARRAGRHREGPRRAPAAHAGTDPRDVVDHGDEMAGAPESGAVMDAAAGPKCRYLDPAGRIHHSLDPGKIRDVVR